MNRYPPKDILLTIIKMPRAKVEKVCETKEVCKTVKKAAPKKAASRAAPKKAKAVKAQKPASDKKVRRSGERCYKTYIYKVLKQVHPDTGITSASMAVMDALSHYMVERLVDSSNRVRLGLKTATVTSRDVQTAVRLVLPSELAKHAVSEGTKRVAAYANSKSGAVKGAKAVSGAVRAGLQFSPARIRSEIKLHSSGKGCKCRVSMGSAVYLAAVIEYLVAEVLELSGNASRDRKHVRITTNDIHVAIDNDEELNKLYEHVVFPNEAPHRINAALLPKPKKQSK